MRANTGDTGGLLARFCLCFSTVSRTALNSVGVGGLQYSLQSKERLGIAMAVVEVGVVEAEGPAPPPISFK